jgi:hypothetical protein
LPYCLLIFEKEITLKEQLAARSSSQFSPARELPANMVVKEGEIAVSGRIVGYSELKKLHLDSVCEGVALNAPMMVVKLASFGRHEPTAYVTLADAIGTWALSANRNPATTESATHSQRETLAAAAADHEHVVIGVG